MIEPKHHRKVKTFSLLYRTTQSIGTGLKVPASAFHADYECWRLKNRACVVENFRRRVWVSLTKLNLFGTQQLDFMRYHDTFSLVRKPIHQNASPTQLSACRNLIENFASTMRRSRLGEEEENFVFYAADAFQPDSLCMTL